MTKVEKCMTPPASLARKSSYREKDVIDQLEHDFNGKCYICEIKPVQDPEVEHLLPHHDGKYPDRMYDWNNLFYSCGHCNGIKNKSIYEGKVINCCIDDPESMLQFDVKEKKVAVSAINTSIEKASMTAQLINEVFNATSTGLRTKAAQVRFSALQDEMNVLYSNLRLLKTGEPVETKKAMIILPGLLSRKSKFAAFKRNYVRAHLEDYSELEELIKDTH